MSSKKALFQNAQKSMTAICFFVVSGCAVTHVPVSDPSFASVRPISSSPLPIDNGAIYKSGYEIALFEDRKAARVGDILTIVLSERTNASKKASTKTTKDSTVDILPAVGLGLGKKDGIDVLKTEIDASREFDGKGDSSQSNSLTGTISVTVSEVLPNGNLVVRGEKLLTLNQGSEHIRITGIVRPDDISPENTIESAKLADARIIYGGQGVLAESNSKGWFQRAIDSNWWPF
jgi:flagellar L-ring protein precursor FlgH